MASTKLQNEPGLTISKINIQKCCSRCKDKSQQSCTVSILSSNNTALHAYRSYCDYDFLVARKRGKLGMVLGLHSLVVLENHIRNTLQLARNNTVCQTHKQLFQHFTPDFADASGLLGAVLHHNGYPKCWPPPGTLSPNIGGQKQQFANLWCNAS